jgi:DNA-binding transcriptional ArsR family regulator
MRLDNVHLCAYMSFMTTLQTTAATARQAADALEEILDSKFFKALSEPVRVALLRYLVSNAPADIAAIARAFPQDRSVISRHLQVMHAAGILRCEKMGRHVFYQIDGEAVLQRLEGLVQIMRQCLPACCPPAKT